MKLCKEHHKTILSEGEVGVWRHVFDFWRQAYDQLSYHGHQTFYNMVARAFPDQHKYDSAAVATALTQAMLLADGPVRVWELGGWDGALAKEMLAAFPREIDTWVNAEICQDALEQSYYYDDTRYEPYLPERWVWDTAVQRPAGFHLGVLSHVIEHLDWMHLMTLLWYLEPVPVLYIQTPASLGEDPHPTRWMGTLSTHKLEVGWRDIRRHLAQIGYWEIWHKDQARLFAKGGDYATRT